MWRVDYESLRWRPEAAEEGTEGTWAGNRRKWRLAMSRLAVTVMGKAGSGKGGVGWRANW